MSRIGEALRRAETADEIPDLSDELRAPLSREEPVVSAVTDAATQSTPDPVAPMPPADDGPALAPLGVLETVEQETSEKLVMNPALAPFAVEQYRRLAAILHHAQEARGIKKILVGSALAAEGKTLTAINLALTLSQSYARRVLLIDADLRRPGISHVFGFPQGAGLSEALESNQPHKLGLAEVSPLLSILPGGRPTSDPMAGLTSPRMAQLLDEAAERFDWVIIDSPPIGLLTDAKLLAAMADGALLVVAADRTPFDALRRAADALGRERLLGVVLNRVDEKSVSPASYYEYSYYYGANGRNGNGSKRGIVRRLIGRK